MRLDTTHTVSASESDGGTVQEMGGCGLYRYTAYQWYHDAQPISGATEQFYHAPTGLSGQYHCVMQTQAGTTEQSCPEDFGDIRRSADDNPGQQPERQIVARRTMWISPVFRVEITTYSNNTIQAEKQCVIQH